MLTSFSIEASKELNRVGKHTTYTGRIPTCLNLNRATSIGSHPRLACFTKRADTLGIINDQHRPHASSKITPPTCTSIVGIALCSPPQPRTFGVRGKPGEEGKPATKDVIDRGGVKRRAEGKRRFDFFTFSKLRMSIRGRKVLEVIIGFFLSSVSFGPRTYFGSFDLHPCLDPCHPDLHDAHLGNTRHTSDTRLGQQPTGLGEHLPESFREQGIDTQYQAPQSKIRVSTSFRLLCSYVACTHYLHRARSVLSAS